MRLKRSHERHGVILMVVLSLLTLFAIVGITFVLYADSEATSARIARESESMQHADVDPEQALALFLNQFIYDVNDDASGVGSALRGHSLARTMYGYMYPTVAGGPLSNIVPFNGIGRLHYTGPYAQDNYNLINYTWFSADGFVRDPERYGTRATPTTAQSNAYVGANAPYTYPDFNNLFLAAVDASGNVLAPSYHRNYVGASYFGSLDPTNPNWYIPSTTNPALKYMVLRPRPADHPGFPATQDAGGDVKNLVGAPGGNDSIWIDIGAPVMTAPDGTKYKMLVAPLIIDLDGRINLNVCGNVLGAGATPLAPHRSNQGWGSWEVNPSKVFNPGAPLEYGYLFTGNGSKPFGKYGANQLPSDGIGSILSGTLGHFYSQGDINSLNENAPGTPSSRPVPPAPAPAPNALTGWPIFGQGYGNGGTLNGVNEALNHPLLYIPFRAPNYTIGYPSPPVGPAGRSINDDSVFAAAEMEALLRPNSTGATPVDTGSAALVSQLLRLCPNTFGTAAPNGRYRNMVTTLSMDLGSPGVIPYWYSLAGANPAPYSTPAGNPQNAPLAVGEAFPTVPPPGPPLPPALPAVTNNPVGPPPNPSEFGADWRALSAALGRIQLNRPLPPYPHMGQYMTPPYGAALSAFGAAYDTTNAGVVSQYNAALGARQSLAGDIYSCLIAVTGVPRAPAPGVPDVATRRWLAQLAVNIVDYIDEDDIITPFNFPVPGIAGASGATQPPGPAGDETGPNPNDQSGNNATGANPTYWVFGTELPKVVLNEAVAEARNSTLGLPILSSGDTVQVWIELRNTMPVPPLPANTQAQDGLAVPLFMTAAGPVGGYSPYRVTIARNLMSPPGDPSGNVLGKVNVGPAWLPISTTDMDFKSGKVNTKGGTAVPSAVTPYDPTNPGTGYFLVGPTPPGANYRDPFTDPTIPANTPLVRTPDMSYTPIWVAGGVDERSTGLTILLRRLANPYLPLQPDPSMPNYNPYVTVDYLDKVPIRSNGVPPPPAPIPSPLPTYASRGKCQPYGAWTPPLPPPVLGVWPPPPPLTSPVQDQTVALQASGVAHTFGLQNNPTPQSGNYDWLVHLDRPVISPLELLHVSAWPPHMLTQQFVTGTNAITSPTTRFQHYAPWLDVPPAPSAATAAPWFFDPSPAGAGGAVAGQTHRLHRLFEFLESGDRVTGVNGLGRIPGKVNINTVWDTEILRAICDANASIGATDATIDAILTNLKSSRTPAGVPGPTDRPFFPLGIGLVPSGAQFPPGPLQPTFPGLSVTQDTLLRMTPLLPPPAPPPTQLLFQNPTDTNMVHPYLQTQLLTKIYNNVTTRSNTFAVFLTVGFFEVTNPNASPPTLGAEIGRTEGRQVRHRMFALVDRTNLQAAPGSGSATAVLGPTPSLANPAGPNNPSGNATITLSTLGWLPAVAPASGATYTNPRTGQAWNIQTGAQLVVEAGTANEETIVVQTVTIVPDPMNPMNPALNRLTINANFAKKHPNPALTGMAGGFSVIQRGNPGPQSAYDPRYEPTVVPYYSIID